MVWENTITLAVCDAALLLEAMMASQLLQVFTDGRPQSSRTVRMSKRLHSL